MLTSSDEVYLNRADGSRRDVERGLEDDYYLTLKGVTEGIVDGLQMAKFVVNTDEFDFSNQQGEEGYDLAMAVIEALTKTGWCLNHKIFRGMYLAKDIVARGGKK